MAGAPITLLNDVTVMGSWAMGLDRDFPVKPTVGSLWLKDGMLFAYLKLGTITTWYPLTRPTKSYVHRQAIAADTWIVRHNLASNDLWYQVQDERGHPIYASVVRTDENTLTVSFVQPTAGLVVVVAAGELDVPIVTTLEGVFGNGKVIINESGIYIDGTLLVPGGDGLTRDDVALMIRDETSARKADIAYEMDRADAAIAAAVADEAAARDAAIIAAFQSIHDWAPDIAEAIAQEVINRNTAIDSGIAVEVVNRNDAIADAIAGLASDEADARNAAIVAAITREVTDRDNAIAAAINTEVTNRDAAIAQEVTNRNAAINTAVTNLIDGAPADGNTLAKLRSLISAIQTVLQSNDVNLDTIQELVTRIKSDEGLIASITTGKLNVSDIIDNLTSTATDKALSANQGRVLNNLISTLDAAVVKVAQIDDTLVSTNSKVPLSANQGRALKALIDSLTTTVGTKANTSSLATVATTGSYADLLNKPVLAAVAYSGLKADVGLGNVENVALSSFGIATTSTQAGIADLDDATVPAGMYYVSPSTIGTYPNSTAVTGMVLHKVYGTAGFQMFQPQGADKMYFRRRTGSVWQAWQDVMTKASLATVATTGSYTDLINKPVLATSATTDTTNANNITSGTLSAGRLPAFVGDVTAAAGTGSMTLASVNANTGSVGSGTAVPVLNLDAKGRVLSATTAAITPAGIGAVASTALGVANGVATLDGTGKLTASQVPASLLGGMNYQGVWNASTNSPALASGVGTKGFYYKVSVAGSTSIDGNAYWQVGDMISFNGTTWDRLEGGPTEVSTVAGRTGAIILTSADIGGLAASATTDTTNAANISSGTLPAARMPARTGDVTSPAGSTVMTLANSGATAGTYGSSNTVPVMIVDAKGRVTGASNVAIALAAANVSGLAPSATIDTTNAANITSGTLPAARLPAFTGDITTNAGTTGTSLSVILGNPGTYGSASNIPLVTVDSKGRVTGISNGQLSQLFLTDTRSVNVNPWGYQGLSLHLKSNSTDGLSDGGSYHGVLNMAQWTDYSGGAAGQLAYTDNGNVWFRSVTNSTTPVYGTWYKLLQTKDVVDNLTSNATNVPLSANQGRLLSVAIAGKMNSSDVIDALTSTSTTQSLSANQGRVLNNAIATMDTAKTNVADIVDTLTSTSSKLPLSANQGRVLAALIDTKVAAAEEDMSTVRSGKDANGIYVTIDRKRLDGTLYKRSVLSGGTSPNYTTRTVTYYDAAGTTVIKTLIYALTYTGSDLTSEIRTQ